MTTLELSFSLKLAHSMLDISLSVKSIHFNSWYPFNFLQVKNILLYFSIKSKATGGTVIFVLFVVAVSEHFRAGSEALPFLIYIYKMYHFENAGTLAEGIEKEQ